jgi:hypothetical protein
MSAKHLKTVPKISVKIWRPIIEALDKKLDAACLRRDAYLNKVLQVELSLLDEEVSIPNSQESYDYVSKQLDMLDRKLVSLALSSVLTERLNEICRRKRVVRDAFFNRLFLLLAASPKVIDVLLFGSESNDWRKMVWNEIDHDSVPFDEFYPLRPAINPFWAIRRAFELYADDSRPEDFVPAENSDTIRVQRDLTGVVMPAESLYTTIFERKLGDHDLAGLNCYLPDWRIPGNIAEQQHNANLDELLGISVVVP